MLIRTLLTYFLINFLLILSAAAPDDDFSSNCGDILRTANGRISYKYFGSVEPNERCIWILRYPNATSYFVRVINYGVPSSVIVSAFGYLGAVNHAVPKPTAEMVQLDNTTAVVITFYTGTKETSKNRGFSLWYSAVTSEKGVRTSDSSEDHIFPASIGHIRYPSRRRQMYGNDELSIFAITPVHNYLTGFRRTEVIYIKSELDGVSCNDRLEVYHFQKRANTTLKWKSLGPICGGSASEIISNNDLILITFQSDGSLMNTGFHLYSRFNHCEESEEKAQLKNNP